MTTINDNQASLRHLPKVQTLLESQHAQAILADMPRPVVLDEVRSELEALRQRVLTGDATPPFSEAEILAAVVKRLQDKDLKMMGRLVRSQMRRQDARRNGAALVEEPFSELLAA